MKMRKILSFVLVLSLVLGSFSMAFAATPSTGLSDIAGNANEQAIEVAYNLGIVTGNPDGTFLPNKDVTRAEFAALITRALNIPESALAGYKTTNFKDTTGYGWAISYLAFCQSKGIMIGDGQGNVMPGRTINTNEAVTMALRAIGYTNNSSKLVGTWPANYVTLAQTEGLYDGIAATTNVNKASAAQIIYNLLTVGLVQVNTDGQTVALGKSVTNNGVTDFVATTLLTANHGAVAADEVVVYEDSAMINTIKYVGDYATVYRDKETEKVIAIGKIKSTALDGKLTSLSGAGTTMGGIGSFEFKADDVTYVASGYWYDDYFQFKNADPASNFSYTVDDKMILNVKLQGKKIVEVYSVEKWNADGFGLATTGDINDIEDGKLMGFNFATDKNDEIVASSFELVGVSSLDDIKKDHVVYVYQDSSDKEIRKVAVGTKVVEGKVTKISGSKYTVDGVAYEFSSLSSSTKPGTGKDVKLSLDAYGKIFKCEVTGDAADKYAVVIATGSGVDGSRVRVFDASKDGETVYSYTSDANFTGVSEKALFGYALNKDGKINKIETTVLSDATMKLNTKTVLAVGATTHAVKTDAVVITYDSSKDEYAVSSIGKIQTDTALTQSAVSAQAITNKDGIVVALLVDAVNAGKTAEDVYGVINTVDGVYDATQDDSVQLLKGFAAGASFEKNTNAVLTISPANFATTAALFKIEYDSDGYIKALSAQTDSTANGTTIAALANNNHSVQLNTTGGAWVQIADKAVVYEITDFGNADDHAYRVSSVDGFKAPTASTSYRIWVYETDKDSEGYDVVIYTKW